MAPVPTPPVFNQVNLVVQDMDATIAFYRKVGLAIDAPPGAHHVAVPLPQGLLLEFDTTEFVRQWDSGWHGPTGGSAVLGFSMASREAVDRTYADLTGAGYRGHQSPYDAFWGARYAIVAFHALATKIHRNCQSVGPRLPDPWRS